jgi:cytochrome-b5 reductase
MRCAHTALTLVRSHVCPKECRFEQLVARIVCPECWCVVPGAEVVRSYTPVAAALQEQFLPEAWSEDCLSLMVKECAGGLMSRHLCSLRSGDAVRLGPAVGSLRLSAMSGTSRLCLLAAGSGLTPMVNLILWALSTGRNKRL